MRATVIVGVYSMAYNKEQIDALRKYYPVSNYEELNKYFPGKSKKQIKSVARYYGIHSLNPGHRKDLTEQVFGDLTVIGIDHVINGKVYWRCKCSCGKECITVASVLKRGKTNCGCNKKPIVRKDHTGEKFGMLTAIERLPNYQGKGRTYYKCVCDCGNKKIVSGSSLVTGQTKTCGCIARNKGLFKEYLKLKYDDKRPVYQIYCHKAPNSKVYIGITKQSTSKRWQNGNGYCTQTKFWNAINKYGWSNFEHIILEKGLTEKDACEREQFYIQEFKSTNPKFGYNTSIGGSTGRSLVNPIMQYYNDIPVNFFESLTHAAKMLDVSTTTVRNYISGNSLINGYRFEQMEAIHIYDISPDLYDIFTPEHLTIGLKMKAQLRKKTIERNKKGARKICQYDTNGHFIKVFDSISAAKLEIENCGSLDHVLNKNNISKSAGGYLWKYDDGDYSDIEPLQTNGKAVMQIDPVTGLIVNRFSSMADAQRETGISNKQIWKCCNGQRATTGGYIWRYE